jgi:hypothetical protein
MRQTSSIRASTARLPRVKLRLQIASTSRQTAHQTSCSWASNCPSTSHQNGHLDHVNHATSKTWQSHVKRPTWLCQSRSTVSSIFHPFRVKYAFTCVVNCVSNSPANVPSNVPSKMWHRRGKRRKYDAAKTRQMLRQGRGKLAAKWHFIGRIKVAANRYVSCHDIDTTLTRLLRTSSWINFVSNLASNTVIPCSECLYPSIY